MAKFDGKIEITFSQQDRALLKRVADGIEALGPEHGAKVRRLIEAEGDAEEGALRRVEPLAASVYGSGRAD